IEELLQQDETDNHNDALRRDLNALTEEQWQYYFKIERKEPDIEPGGQLIARENERPRVLYIWVAAVAAGFSLAIGAIQVSHYFSYRRLCRTIVAGDTSHLFPSPPRPPPDAPTTARQPDCPIRSPSATPPAETQPVPPHRRQCASRQLPEIEAVNSPNPYKLDTRHWPKGAGTM